MSVEVLYIEDDVFVAEVTIDGSSYLLIESELWDAIEDCYSVLDWDYDLADIEIGGDTFELEMSDVELLHEDLNAAWNQIT